MKIFILVLILFSFRVVNAQQAPSNSTDSVINYNLKILQQKLKLNETQLTSLFNLYREFQNRQKMIISLKDSTAEYRSQKMKELVSYQDTRLKEILTISQYAEFNQERVQRQARAVDSLRKASMQRSHNNAGRN